MKANEAGNKNEEGKKEDRSAEILAEKKEIRKALDVSFISARPF